MTITNRLPAEWEEQSAVLLAWPHAGSDWAPLLDQVEENYLELARAIIRFERLIILSADPEPLLKKLETEGLDTTRIDVCRAATNDTWIRDYGPLTVCRKL